jgi:hypothetical protein
MNVSAFERRSLAIWELTSLSVTSYDALATMRPARLPSPRRRPLSRSFP